jgi:hypothetical protein
VKDYESTNEALLVHGISTKKYKKRENGKSKSSGRNNSLGNSKAKCWNYDKVGNFIRDYKEKKKKNKENNDYDDKYEKYSQGDGGYAFFTTLASHAG